jgi:alpha-ketoglutaric semialdehyde dehydrogenase
MEPANVWIGGEDRAADYESVFQASNPSTGEKLARIFPTSRWSDCDRALSAATEAAHQLEAFAPEKIADFLEAYATGIEALAETLAEAAHEETGLAISPRLKEVELPRTIDQLRQAAAACRQQSWRRVTVDGPRNLRSCLAPIGPVVIFGPNNFPFAYNAVSGGDFAAAIAAGNPVIAKAHPLHPHTSQLLANEASRAILASDLPPATVQMVYNVNAETGLRLVGDSRVGAVAFTGSKTSGLRLKHAAEDAGRPIYLEMSSLNPVVFLPHGMQEHFQRWAGELVDSCTAGAGQFCTRPNLVFIFEVAAAENFLREVSTAFDSREPQPLLSSAVREQLHAALVAIQAAGATVITGAHYLPGASYRYANTLLQVDGNTFLSTAVEFQRETFGNAVLVVTVESEAQLLEALDHLEGNLTGSIYSAASGSDDDLYTRVAPVLRRKVGRLLNDKMPTGVAVSPAMNHGGPYPATGHPGFTAVGFPASITRFAALQCYDNVRQDRLPLYLRLE